MTNEGVKVAEKLFQNIVGLQPTRVKLGVGSFITFDFGKDIPEQDLDLCGLILRTEYFLDKNFEFFVQSDLLK